MGTLSQLALAVASIPHLDLGLEFDLSRMREEVSRIDRYEAYRTQNPVPRDYYAQHWSGVSLVGTNGDAYRDLSELDPDEVLNYAPTAIAELCPYLFTVVEAVGGGTRRARVMRIGPEGSLHWHSHCLLHGCPMDQLTVHVPIAVPEGFHWSVIQAEDYAQHRDSNPASTLHSAGELVHRLSYAPGRATVFNSFHYHNVHNPDSTAQRISLMVYISLRDARARELVSRAVQQYTGPRLRWPSEHTLRSSPYGLHVQRRLHALDNL